MIMTELMRLASGFSQLASASAARPLRRDSLRVKSVPKAG